MKAVICLAGGIATGKTTLAQTLADRWPNSSVRSFGEVVRAHARIEGLPTDRGSLQRVGLRLIDHGWPAFCEHLLGDLPEPCDVLIIDGIRHVEPVHELRRRFPSTPVRVILLRPPPAVIAQRLRQRGEPAEVRDHTVESETGALATVADLIVDSTRPVADVADEIQQLTGGSSRPARGPRPCG